jgi:hypothetical protein
MNLWKDILNDQDLSSTRIFSIINAVLTSIFFTKSSEKYIFLKLFLVTGARLGEKRIKVLGNVLFTFETGQLSDSP